MAANHVGRAMIWEYKAPLLPSAKSMVGAVGITAVDSSQRSVLRCFTRWCKMLDRADGARSEKTVLCDRNVSFHPARNIHISSLCRCLLRYLSPVPNKATETVVFFLGEMFAPTAAAAGGRSSRQASKQQASRQEAGNCTFGNLQVLLVLTPSKALRLW